MPNKVVISKDQYRILVEAKADVIQLQKAIHRIYDYATSGIEQSDTTFDIIYNDSKIEDYFIIEE